MAREMNCERMLTQKTREKQEKEKYILIALQEKCNFYIHMLKHQRKMNESSNFQGI